VLKQRTHHKHTQAAEREGVSHGETMVDVYIRIARNSKSKYKPPTLRTLSLRHPESLESQYKRDSSPIIVFGFVI
jgi:hypothetical protein